LASQPLDYRSLKVIETCIPFGCFGTVSYSTSIIPCGVALCCIISGIKRDIGRKSRFFHHHCIDAPIRGPRRIIVIRYSLVYKKNQNGVAIGLPDGVKIEYALSTEYRRISACDGCTDRHLASATAFSALYIASRGKNRT